MSESSTILLAFAGGIILGTVVIYFLTRKNQGLTMLQNQIQELTRTMDNKLGVSAREMRESIQAQIGESRKLITDITREITEVKETNKQVFSVTEQIQNLEKVLTNQKQRGNLGEASLELVLNNITAPGVYELQYQFKNGDIVDAIIKTREGVIPVDAKFSLDNYRRLLDAVDEKQREQLERDFKNDLKKRIDETAKYIRPEEGTLPFAFMFIPAEGIYYDLLVNEVGAVRVNTRNLIDYAYNDKRVVIVSPTTFAAYLQSVLYGFKAFQIEQSAKDIQKRIEELGRHWASYDEYMIRLGKALGTTISHYNTAQKELKKVDKDVLRITGSEAGISEPLALEKPEEV